IEKMNVLRSGRDRYHRPLARNVAVADAGPNESAAAVEIEDCGVAEILDQFHSCPNSVRRDPDCARPDADDDRAFAAFFQACLEAMAYNVNAAIAIVSRDQVHRRTTDKGRDIDR